MGKFPHEIDSIPVTRIIDIISDFIIPDSISSEVIKKRPDIIAAELQLTSVQYAIGIAKASLFPTVILSASLQQTDKKIEDFFKENNITGMLGITLNYSDKFKSVKKSVLHEKKLLYRNTVYEYRNKLVTAFHDVQKALYNYKMTHEQLVSIGKQINVSNHICKEMDERYKKGLVLYQNLLNVQNDLFDAQEKKIIIEKNLIMQKINLHKAVGGEWE
jgi:outer membrane protein TolC